MPKMGFSSVVEEIMKKFAWAAIQIQNLYVNSSDLKKYGLKKPRGVKENEWMCIWALGFGQMGEGQQLTWVYGHELLDAAKCALEKVGGGEAKEAG